jgi:hypothetical protein
LPTAVSLVQLKGGVVYAGLRGMAFSFRRSFKRFIWDYNMFVTELIIVDSFFINTKFLYCMRIKTFLVEVENLHDTFRTKEVAIL